MTTLIAGASGATGIQLVKQLLERGERVKIIVRSAKNLPAAIANHSNLTLIEASILDLNDSDLVELTRGCSAIVSCLGHNLTFKGLFGAPYRLVTNATRRLCAAAIANQTDVPVRFILMNTAGNSNRDLDEPISFGQKCVIALLRLLLPPHADNEKAADFLRTEIGQSNDAIEWSVVRPDNLLDEAEPSDYSVHPSPIRSAIFDSGVTSRINVGCFMAELITCDRTWNRWAGKMPVIYNECHAPVLASTR